MPPNGTLRVIDGAEDFTVDVNRCFGPLARPKTYSDQVRRAVGSVSANLIEGYSRGPGADRLNRYKIARASCEETLGWIRKSYRMGELGTPDYFRLTNRGVTIVRMINGLKY
jgi:four helix bundle protein